MPYLVPIALLYGFLAVFVRHSDNDARIVPLVLLAFAVPTLLAFMQDKEGWRMRALTLATMSFVGFACFAVFGRLGVVVYDADLGPALLTVPMVFVVVWLSLVLGADAVARKLAPDAAVGSLVAGVLLGLFALVLAPSGFGMGWWAYHGSGVYYGIPAMHIAFFGISGIIGALTLRSLTASTRLSALRGTLLFVGLFTGSAIGLGSWIPAILGLMLLQLGYRVLYYL